MLIILRRPKRNLYEHFLWQIIL